MRYSSTVIGTGIRYSLISIIFDLVLCYLRIRRKTSFCITDVVVACHCRFSMCRSSEITREVVVIADVFFLLLFFLLSLYFPFLVSFLLSFFFPILFVLLTRKTELRTTRNNKKEEEEEGENDDENGNYDDLFSVFPHVKTKFYARIRSTNYSLFHT